MALAVDTTTSHGNGTSSATSITWSHTCSGTERLLVVAVPCSRAVAPTVTYNSVSMTLAVSRVNGVNRAYIFYLINPASGANDVTVSYGSSLQFYTAAAVSFTGADQTDPIGASNTAAGTAGNKSLSMTTEADGSYLIDCIGSAGTLHTAGAGQTAFNDSQNRVSSYKSAPTAGTNGTSWTGSPSTAYAYALLEVLASPTQDISPTGIASAEAFGDHVVSLEVNCSGITSAEAFGDHVVSLEINPSGITSAEAFGDHIVSLEINPSGVTSGEAFGTQVVSLEINPSGITSQEAFGDHIVSLEINPSGVTSGEAFGDHVVSLEINCSGITSQEAFGDHIVSLEINPSGITSQEAFGDHVVSSGLSVLPSGITSGEAFGDHVVSLEINCSGITSQEAFGTQVVSLEINNTGITSGEAFGDHIVSSGLFVNPTGITSSEAFGTQVVSLEINNTGITSAEAIGDPVVSLEVDQIIYPDGISSSEAFGTPSIFTPIDKVNLITAVRTRLLTVSDVTDLADSRIYPLWIAQGGTYPAVSLQVISDLPGLDLEGTSGLTTPRLQVSIYSQTYSDSDQLAEAIITALHNFSGNPAGLTIHSCHLENRTDLQIPPEMANDDAFYFVSLDFMLLTEI